MADVRAFPREVKIDANHGGGDDGGMEARIAKLESSLEYVQRDISEIKQEIRQIRDNARVDFRILFGALITVALGLAGMMARGFHWV